jgi:putative membrane protein
LPITILNDINENFDGLVEDELSGYAEFVVNSQWLIFLIFMLAIVIISFAYSLIITVLTNYDLNLKLNDKGLKLVKGLLNREETSINKTKIQVIGWSDNPIRRFFKMWTLSLEQASSEDATKLQSKIKVPGCYKEQVERVIRSVFPKMSEHLFSKHRVSKLLYYRLLLLVSFVPFLLALGTYYWIQWQVLWFTIWPIFTSIYITFYYRKRSYEISSEIFQEQQRRLWQSF